MKALDRRIVAERMFWTARSTDRSWNDVVARRDARVLRITRRLTRRYGIARKDLVVGVAMVDRSGIGVDTTGSLVRLIRRQLVAEFEIGGVKYYVATSDPIGDRVAACPMCGQWPPWQRQPPPVEQHHRYLRAAQLAARERA